MKQDQINFIREKCIEVNPEMEGQEVNTRFMKGKIQRIIGWESRPIRLADVLLALEKVSDERHGIRAEKDGWFFAIAQNVIGMYNLSADDLREQSDETIKFLYDLLK